MSKSTYKAERQNKAIVDKVASILDNTDYIDEVRIVIEGSRQTCPTIEYKIKEFILTDTEQEEEE